MRRLEALEHVANSIQGNPNTQKTPFVLPDLAHYEDKAHDLANALHEFVTIERLVTLNDWKATRHAPPERRVLMGGRGVMERRFREAFHLAPQQYLRRLRIRLACHPLVYSERTLAEIATAHGFCDQSHFNRTFKRFTGMAPGQYRSRITRR